MFILLYNISKKKINPFFDYFSKKEAKILLQALHHKKGRMKMTITEVKFRRFINEGKLRAVVSLTFDGSFAVHDIKIVQGEERLFVAMPSRRDDNGVFRDIVHPIDSELRNEIEEEILSAYRMELDRQAAEQQDLS